jgi:hypothetical protein
VPHELEIASPEKMPYIPLPAGKIVIETDDLMAFIDKPFAEVRAEKPGAAGYQYAELFHAAILCAAKLTGRPGDALTRLVVTPP